MCPLANSSTSLTSTTTAFSRLMSCTAADGVKLPTRAPRDTAGHINMPAEANATAINAQLSTKNFT